MLEVAKPTLRPEWYDFVESYISKSPPGVISMLKEITVSAGIVSSSPVVFI